MGKFNSRKIIFFYFSIEIIVVKVSMVRPV